MIIIQVTNMRNMIPQDEKVSPEVPNAAWSKERGRRSEILSRK